MRIRSVSVRATPRWCSAAVRLGATIAIEGAIVFVGITATSCTGHDDGCYAPASADAQQGDADTANDPCPGA
jgi:hypothetical protein